jgi:hypothetical protein
MYGRCPAIWRQLPWPVTLGASPAAERDPVQQVYLCSCVRVHRLTLTEWGWRHMCKGAAAAWLACNLVVSGVHVSTVWLLQVACWQHKSGKDSKDSAHSDIVSISRGWPGYAKMTSTRPGLRKHQLPLRCLSRSRLLCTQGRHTQSRSLHEACTS